MAQWLDDHLLAAPPSQWLPGWLADRRVRVIGTAMPRALRRMLAACTTPAPGAPLDVLVHAGELWKPLAVDAESVAALAQGGTLLDLAWVASWTSALSLQPWRRTPGQRAAAARVEDVLALGLSGPQQWVGATSPTLVITLGVRRD